MILNDVEQDPRHFSQVSDQIKFQTRTLLGVPMPIKDRTVGVLEALNKRDGIFNDRDVAILSVTAAHAAIAINNARLLKTTQQALEKVRETNSIKVTSLRWLRMNCGLLLASLLDMQPFCRKRQKVNFLITPSRC